LDAGEHRRRFHQPHVRRRERDDVGHARSLACKDYEDRRRTQARRRKYKGRPENAARNAGIAAQLRAGMSWSASQLATGCSRATIAKIAKIAKRAA
jgi:hypothetical protein